MLSPLRQSRATLFCFTFCSIFTIGQAYGEFSTTWIVPPQVAPSSIGSDTQLNLFAGGEVGVFFEAGAEDGTSMNVEVNISGGTVNSFFDANSGSAVNITGGSVGDNFDAWTGSAMNISGGTVGSGFDANSGSAVNIFGGEVNIYFDAHSGSTVNISGGSIGEGFHAYVGSEVNLFGTQFVLDSMDITASLTLNVPFPIYDRDVTLSGALTDGSLFSFDLNSTNELSKDYFDLGAALTVTLILPGDFDLDGDVDGTDFLKWQQGEMPMPLSSTDLATWQANFGNVASSLAAATAAVPEPSCIVVLLAAFTCSLRRWRLI